MIPHHYLVNFEHVKKNNRFVLYHKDAIDRRHIKSDIEYEKFTENLKNLQLPDILVSLIEKYKKCIEDPASVFMMYGNDHLIIMQKYEDTVTNEFDTVDHHTLQNGHNDNQNHDNQNNQNNQISNKKS